MPAKVLIQLSLTTWLLLKTTLLPWHISCNFVSIQMHLLIQATLSFFCVKNVVTNTKYIYPDYHGDNIEICTPKEGDRIIISGSLVALGAWAGKAAGSAAIGWGINKWFG